MPRVSALSRLLGRCVSSSFPAVGQLMIAEARYWWDDGDKVWRWYAWEYRTTNKLGNLVTLHQSWEETEALAIEATSKGSHLLPYTVEPRTYGTETYNVCVPRSQGKVTGPSGEEYPLPPKEMSDGLGSRTIVVSDSKRSVYCSKPYEELRAMLDGPIHVPTS